MLCNTQLDVGTNPLITRSHAARKEDDRKQKTQKLWRRTPRPPDGLYVGFCIQFLGLRTLTPESTMAFCRPGTHTRLEHELHSPGLQAVIRAIRHAAMHQLQLRAPLAHASRHTHAI